MNSRNKKGAHLELPNTIKSFIDKNILEATGKFKRVNLYKMTTEFLGKQKKEVKNDVKVDIPMPKPFAEMTPADWDRMLEMSE